MERGCVADQPQHEANCSTRRKSAAGCGLVEADTTTPGSFGPALGH